MSYGLTLDSMGLVAGTLRHFKVPDIINEAIHKKAHNSGIDYGSLVVAMLLQLTYVPYQGLWNLNEFHEDSPLCLLLGVDIDAKDLNRYALGRCLDAIHKFGPERLYLAIAAQVLSELDITIKEVHIDSTSYHYDGQSKQEPNCLIQAKQGYSRDHRPDLNQFVQVMLVESEVGLPIYAKAYSGQINDKTSFLDIAEHDIKYVVRQFQELSYFIGDSALCTAKIINSLLEKGLHSVTRVPDNLEVAVACFEYAMQHEDEFVPLEHGDRNDPYSALWAPDGVLFGAPVKLLVVRNDALHSSKEATIRKEAEKEKEQINKKLKKLRTRPAKCQPDAQKNLDEIKSQCKLTSVVVEGFTQNLGYAHRGAPKNGEQKVIKSVSVQAHAELDEAAIAAKVNDSIKFVIATTDVKRDWSMYDLKATYTRQSLIERDWRLSKDPKYFIDAFYLEKPSRINALLWLLSVAILVFVATEHLLHQRCREHKIKVPNPDGSSRGSTRLTFARVRNIFFNHHIRVHVDDDLHVDIENMRELDRKIVQAMGAEWSLIYDKAYVRTVMAHHFKTKWWPAKSP